MEGSSTTEEAAGFVRGSRVPDEAVRAAPAAKRPRRGAAPLPGTFVGAGSDSVAQRETASVLAAVRGEAAPTTVFSSVLIESRCSSD